MATGPPHRLPSRAGYPDRRGRAPTSLPVRGAAGDARARCSGHPRLSRTGRDPVRPRGHQCENEYRLRDRKSPFPFCPSVRRLRSALHGAAPAWRRSIRDQPRICPLGSASLLLPGRKEVRQPRSARYVPARPEGARGRDRPLREPFCQSSKACRTRSISPFVPVADIPGRRRTERQYLPHCHALVLCAAANARVRAVGCVASARICGHPSLP